MSVDALIQMAATNKHLGPTERAAARPAFATVRRAVGRSCASYLAIPRAVRLFTRSFLVAIFVLQTLHVATGAKLLRTFSGHQGAVYALAFTADRDYLVSAGEDRQVRLWQLQSKPIDAEELRRRHKLVEDLDDESFLIRQQAHEQLAAIGAAMAPALRTVANESESREARYRAQRLLNGFEAPFGFGHQREIRSLVTSSSEGFIASASRDGTVRLWTRQNALASRVIQSHADGAWSLAFAPNGTDLASGGGDHDVHIWNAVAGTRKLTLRGHTNTVQDLDFSPDGKLLASAGGFDTTVRVWHTDSGQEVAVLKDNQEATMRVTFDPAGKLIATAGYGPRVSIWRTANWQRQQSFATECDVVRCLQFSADGRYLAVGGNTDTLTLISTRDFKRKIVLAGHTRVVLCVAFAGDQTTVATGDAAGNVRLWGLGADE